MPYFALPSTFDGMSMRGSGLPIETNWPSGTSGAVAGGVSSAASAATWPYVQPVPEGTCVITPFTTR